MTIAENTRPYLIFVTTAITSGGVLFFQAGAFFCIENAEYWRILAILSRIYALFGALITGLNSAVVPKN